MHISFYCSEHLEGVADLLHEMSVHYNGSNASSRDAVRTNLVSNILAPTSGVTLVLAIENDKVIGLAAISLLYPAPKETAQLFMKELYVSSGHRGQGTGTALMRWMPVMRFQIIARDSTGRWMRSTKLRWSSIAD